MHMQDNHYREKLKRKMTLDKRRKTPGRTNLIKDLALGRET